MRRILSAGLFWLGLLAFAGAALSVWTGARSTEGLADLGWFVFAVLLTALAGGLMGGYLLAAPRGAPRWRLGVASALAVLALAAVALLALQGVDAGTARVALFLAIVALPALAGLARSPRLWRA